MGYLTKYNDEFLAALPQTNSCWKHRNGIEYTVLHLANTGYASIKYPINVVYRGANGNVWVKTLHNFLETMTEI